MKVKNILNNLDKIAPFFLQENFDNSGIQFADLVAPVTKILLSLDVITIALPCCEDISTLQQTPFSMTLKFIGEILQGRTVSL